MEGPTISKVSYPHTPEDKRKLSEMAKKSRFWEKRKSVWNKGLKWPIEQRQKISLALKGRKMPWVAIANSKRTYSEKTREKRRLVAEKLWTNPEFRKKMLERMSGPNSPSWIADRSLIKTHENRRDDANYFFWRKSVFVRDSFTCCLKNADCRGKITAHHILPWKEYPESRYNINNGITLCRAHHPHHKVYGAEDIDFSRD
jgi:hypothetical protein